MLLTIQHPSFPSYEVALSSDDRQGDTFASASNDGVLRIFDLRRSSALHLYHRITFIQWNKHLYLHIESVIETLKPAATHNSSVVANSRGPRNAGRGAKYRGLPVRGPKSNSREPRTSF